MTENKCWQQYSCPARCCYNPSMTLHQSEFDEHFRFLGPTEVDMFGMVELVFDTIPTAIRYRGPTELFWADNAMTGVIELQIKGACPYLDTQSNNCTIYSRRPQACRNFRRGGPQCLEIQQKAKPPSLLEP